MFSEIEGHNIEQVADYKFSDVTLDLKRMYDYSVKIFDTFRRGTECIYNPSQIILSESDYKTIYSER